MKKFSELLSKLLKWASGLLLIAIVLILFVGVVLRYIFNAPLFWAGEVTVLALIWCTFLASALLVQNDGHISISTVTDFLPPRITTPLQVISDILVSITLMVMIWQSGMLTKSLALSITPALQIKESYFGIAMIVGFSAMLFFHLINFSDRLINIFSKSNRTEDIS